MIHNINRFFSKNSRWIFGIFTVVIAIAFMDFLSPRSGIGNFLGFGSGSGDFGTVYGETVTVEDMQHGYRLLSLQRRLFGAGSDVKDEEVFQFLALGKAMEKRGIAVGDDEVAAAIQKMFSGSDGKFSQKTFDNFLIQIKRQGFSGRDVDDAVRRMLAELKLQHQLFGDLAVADGEVENFYKLANQRLNVRSRIFRLDAAAVEPTEAELQEQFNLGNYVRPASAQALIVEFAEAGPAREFAQAAYDAVSADESNARNAFEKTAQERKLKANYVPAFNSTDVKVGSYESAELVRQLTAPETPVLEFTLKGAADADGKASEKYLVAYVFNQQPARPSAYEEVKSEVAADASARLKAQSAYRAAMAEATRLKALPEKERAARVASDKDFGAPVPMSMTDPATGGAVAAADVTVVQEANGDFSVRFVESAEQTADMDKFADSKMFYQQRCLALKAEQQRQDFLRELNENCRYSRK